ncbi:hypothetical protein QUF72_17970 [Desulfobacterales bacterium HSG2]|nr:hypothetical protein [Desulfobacterales bacterium HSG2]
MGDPSRFIGRVGELEFLYRWDIDVVVEGEHAVIAAECKNYDPENIDKITAGTVDKFIEKAGRLHKERFPDKELRLAFFSKNGFESKTESYLEAKGIVTELRKE